MGVSSKHSRSPSVKIKAHSALFGSRLCMEIDNYYIGFSFQLLQYTVYTYKGIFERLHKHRAAEIYHAYPVCAPVNYRIASAGSLFSVVCWP